jgi:hypothetical protein
VSEKDAQQFSDEEIWNMVQAACRQFLERQGITEYNPTEAELEEARKRIRDGGLYVGIHYYALARLHCFAGRKADAIEAQRISLRLAPDVE